MTYTALTAELDALLHELEHDDVPLDALTQKVQRCYTLIREGRALLRTAEDAVTAALETDPDAPVVPDIVAGNAEPIPAPVLRRARTRPTPPKAD